MTLACSQCGLLQDLPPLDPGDEADCAICQSSMVRTHGRSVTGGLCIAFATLVLLVPANLLPLLRVEMMGMRREDYLASGAAELWDERFAAVAIFVAIFAVVLPIVRFGLLSLVLGTLRLVPDGGGRPPWLGRAFRWTCELEPWAMPDVFLVGMAVGYRRLIANLSVTVGWGGICFIGAALLSIVARASFDRRAVWNTIRPDREVSSRARMVSCEACDWIEPAESQGSPCTRCGAPLHARRADARSRTLALVIAALAFCVPANVFAMSSELQLGEHASYRIVDGIRGLYRAGLWPLSVLIFFTSFLIPFVKLAGLGWLLLSVRRRSARRLVLKTRLYRFIHELGRWSNVDVFTISVFVPLMQFGSLASAHAGPGATAFLAAVVLTMFAAHSFDPRLLWDAAAEGEP